MLSPKRSKQEAKKGVEMLSQEQIAALKLFNEKADKLKRCSFTRLVFEHESGVSFSAKINEEIKIERTGPDEEAIDAFALTFRFFIQDNEKSSFRNLDRIYNELPLSQLQKESFAKARRELNDYLDAFSIFTVNNERLSNRCILEVFMYGGLSHANEKKKQIFDSWMANPFLSQYLQNEFVFILANVLNVISYIQSLNIEVIKALCDQKTKIARQRTTEGIH